MARKERLPIATFEIPVHKIRRGYYSAVYFWREKQILENLHYSKKALMQIFQKQNAVLCGTDEAVAVFKLCSGFFKDREKAYRLFDAYAENDRLVREAWLRTQYEGVKETIDKKIRLGIQLDELWENKFSDLEVKSLYDGESISPWETVMTVEGLPQHFAHLESVYLGILARRTLVATNTQRVVDAACGKRVLFFADRFDHYSNQVGDGYAAMTGGATGVATDAMGKWWGVDGSGTMPHALIACFDGNTTEATLAFHKNYPDIPCIALVDFTNHCPQESLNAAREFHEKGLPLWGVRLDTSENMVDDSLIEKKQLGEEHPAGVNTLLVENVRNALDAEGFSSVKIVVSGGFNAGKIAYFEKKNVPVDAYGVGSSLLKGNTDFTADIVLVDGKPVAKKGRWFKPNPRLEPVL